MKNESGRKILEAVKNLIAETSLIFSTTTPLPENRMPRYQELLGAALVLTDDLLKQKMVGRRDYALVQRG